MTLVLSVLTPDYVVQASDRRFVWISGGSATRNDDDRNKAVFFATRMILAFTGLAHMGPRRQRTDVWVANVLANSTGDQADRLEAIVRAATDRLSHPLYRRLSPQLRMHEFIAVGWARFPSTNLKAFRPYIAWVTNMRGEDGKRLTQPSDAFRLIWRELPADEPGYIDVAGQALLDQEHLDLLARVGSASGHPAAVGEVLVDAIRTMASRNTAVGRGVLVSVLPRQAIREGDTGTRIFVGGPPTEVPSFLYFSPNKADPMQYGPTVASADGAVLSDLTAGPGGSIFPRR